MISQPLESPVVALSVRFYQMLLVAYPTKFQQEYGPQMLQVFRDCCRQAHRQGGSLALLKLWALTFFDFLHSLIEEHLQKETLMTRSSFIRLSGWSLILGAVTFLLFILLLSNFVYSNYGPMGPSASLIFLLSTLVIPILLAVGLLGLRTRYGDEVGSFGKNVLLFGAIAGPLINIVGITIPQIDSWGWVLPFAGNAVLLACLSIFGIAALSAKPLPRWNSLPFIAGIWYPVIIILVNISEVVGLSQVSQLALATASFIIISVQCVLLAFLGYILQAGVLEETPAIA